jgi:2-methylcitrate dehydratase PrpD
MQLDEKQAKNALGVSVFRAGGLAANVGTMAHIIELAVSARDGIEAAELAKKGFTAHPEVIETPQGLLDAVIGEGEYNLEEITKDLGKNFQVVSPGISIKKYPCCYRSHCALDALFDILKEQDLSYDKIETVTVERNIYDSYLMKYTEPNTVEQARNSYPHILGTAILKGEVWIDSFTEESIEGPLYRKARKKIEVVTHPEWPPGRNDARTPVTVRTKDGREFTKEVDIPRDPTLEQLLDRYRQAAEGILTKEQTERSIDMLVDLEKVEDVSEIMQLIR